MATPHVAGTVALLRSLNHNLTLAQIVGIINETAVAVYSPKGANNLCNFGRVDAFGAVQAVPSGAVEFLVRESATGDPISGTSVILNTGRTGETNASGIVTMTLATGTYTATMESFWHETLSVYPNPFPIYTDVKTFVGAYMSPKPTGNLSGLMFAADTRELLSGTASLTGTPVSTTVSASGQFSLTAPAGTYTVTGAPSLKKYQPASMEATIPAGGTSSVLLSSNPYPTTPVGMGDFTPTGLWNRRGVQVSPCQPASLNGVIPETWHYGVISGTVCTYDTGAANSGTLTSPRFYAKGPTPIVLKFDSWLMAEGSTYYDRASVQVSVDGGAFTTILTVSKTVLGAWVSHEVELPQCFEHTCQIRYLFETVDAFNNNWGGWHLANVLIQNRGALLVANGSIPEKVLPGESFTATLTIVNQGDISATPVPFSFSFSGAVELANQSNKAQLKQVAGGGFGGVIPKLDPGEVFSLTLALKAKATAKNGDLITITIHSATPIYQNDPSLNDWTGIVTVATAELTGDVRAALSTSSSCQTLSATVTVSNTGLLPATGTVVTTTLEADSAVAFGCGAKSVASNYVLGREVHQAGTLIPGRSWSSSPEIFFLLSKPTVFTLTVEMSTETMESNYTNNIVTHSLVILSAKPVITSVTPTRAHRGDVIRIEGQRFGESEAFVSFWRSTGAYTATILSWSDTVITVTVPIEVQPGWMNHGLFLGRSEAAEEISDGVDFTVLPDPRVGFDRVDYIVGENLGRAVVSITLETASNLTVSVSFETQSRTATAGEDFVTTTQKLIFAPGQTLVTVTVPLLDDDQYEEVEIFDLLLTDAVNARLDPNPSRAYVWIVSDDPRYRYFLPIVLR